MDFAGYIRFAEQTGSHYGILAGVVAGIFIILIAHLRFPSVKLHEDEVQSLLENGVIHITSKENAKKILLQKRIRVSAARFLTRREIVWFYLSPIEEQSRIITRKFTKRHRNEPLVQMHIKKLTTAQVQQFRTLMFRRRPLILGYLDKDFEIQKQNIVTTSDIS